MIKGNKHLIFKKISFILLCYIILLCMSSCQHITYYPPKKDFAPEEVQQLFYDNKETFIDVANILLGNNEAYKNREPEGTSKLFLCGSAERYKQYFSQQEYEQLDDFFDTFRPYSIERGYDFVSFTFYCTIFDEVEGIAVMYFEEYTAFERYSQYGIIELADDWYLW